MTSETHALELDAADPLAPFREEFHIPLGAEGKPVIYLSGNSLGLMPRTARAAVDEVMEDWERLAVEGHFKGPRPWYTFHDQFREPMARVVGAQPDEVVVMNTLTANLHFLLASFWRPVPGRTRILIEDGAFPSDTYAAESHVAVRGFDPGHTVVRLAPRPGEHLLRTEAVEGFLATEGDSVALVLLPGVQYYSGQLLDMQRITAAAHRAGALAGFDLAHAAGNVPLALHDWDVDFAAWCTYKYLNAGPGAIGAAFVHERHGNDLGRPRMAGWWGNDPGTRFQMHLNRHFVPRSGAEGWAVSNPPVVAMAPLLASLEQFDRVTMPELRKKSIALTGFLESQIREAAGEGITILTPADPAERGCQLSLLVHERSRQVFDQLTAAGIIADYRPPDVIRMAPTPMYNSFHEMWRVGRVLGEVLG
ncbi:MAG: kynureninase [Gemmatimonadota bacterium]|nr:kynureninase [Gemmatimonadota bacterium]